MSVLRHSLVMYKTYVSLEKMNKSEIITLFIERQKNLFHHIYNVTHKYIDETNFELLVSDFYIQYKHLIYPFLLISLIFILLFILWKYSNRFLSYLKKQITNLNRIRNNRNNYKLTNNIYSTNVTNDLFTWLINSEILKHRLQYELLESLKNSTFNLETTSPTDSRYTQQRFTVEALQFSNTKVTNVSTEEPLLSKEKITIKASLEVEELILNVLSKDRQYTLESPKLTGQLSLVLVVRSRQYSIDAILKQLQTNLKLVDPNNNYTSNEKKLIESAIENCIHEARARYTFQISDHNVVTISSPTLSLSDRDKSHSTSSPLNNSNDLVSTKLTTTNIPEIQTKIFNDNRFDNVPKTTVKDFNYNYDTQNTTPQKHQQNNNLLQKKLLVRIVKGTNLHDADQPYCTLELNNPHQIHKTSIGKAPNPFWDEKFFFECNEQSNEIRIRIIDQKGKKLSYERLYADISIPFHYVTSTVYKQDVIINPNHPDSIIRIEVR
ncbi:unnamed protein product [Didymodactylos carnosus]|uniref:C2 domain-containing protein n=1 Tax=Didymodactylos carnosus TaxID=1234261 RepID=A0A814MTK7_9BILA|nr:unnamed protein product [Didymodactylos carnosus]CAF3849264.1 unnamed protein product [Didymodactylos carnosus]